jgi:hypothetical protein
MGESESIPALLGDSVVVSCRVVMNVNVALIFYGDTHPEIVFLLLIFYFFKQSLTVNLTCRHHLQPGPT